MKYEKIDSSHFGISRFFWSLLIMDYKVEYFLIRLLCQPLYSNI